MEPETADGNPLGIVLLCSGCLRNAIECKCKGTASWEGYLPLRHVPEDVLEAKRAELLEFNSTEGLRKLTDDERARMDPAHADEPDTAENVQSDRRAQSVADDEGMALPPDLADQEGWG